MTESVDQLGDEYLVLVDGYRYEGRLGDIDYRIMKFDRQDVRVESPLSSVSAGCIVYLC